MGSSRELADIPADIIPQLSFKGLIFGLTLSNNVTDSNKDIDISSGTARDLADTTTMSLSSGLTKKLDGAFNPGTNVGGLFSGTVAIDTWYHVFLIEKDSDGSIDVGFDTSITAANIPAGYTAYKWIGSVLTDGSNNILGFTQIGDEIVLDLPQLFYSGTLATSRVERTGVTPLGISCLARIEISMQDTTVGPTYWRIYSPYAADAAVTTDNGTGTLYHTTSSGEGGGIQMGILTNLLSQISTRANTTQGNFYMKTVGWKVERGQI